MCSASAEDKQQSHHRWRGRTKCERMKGNLGAKIPLHGSQACESRHMPYKHSMTQRDPAIGAVGHDKRDGKVNEGRAAAQKPPHAASNGLVALNLNSN